MSGVTPVQAAHVLWHFRDPRGYRPGSFIEKLLDAIGAADHMNRFQLFTAFPGYVTAWEMGARQANGLDQLAAIAALDTA